MTLQNNTPEYLSDDELEARQRVADGEVDEPKAEPDPEAQSAVVEGEAGKTEAEAKLEPETEKVVGVASKDGTRVLPYAALQAERRNSSRASSRAARAEQELSEARQQIADLRAGKKPESTELTEEEVTQMEEDFPETGKKLRAVLNRNQELEAKAPKSAAAEEDPADDPIQEAIDQVPLLAEWQHTDSEKFERAIAIDTALQGSPKWRDKPVSERFAHVARQVADEYDIPVQETKTSKPKPSDPQVVIDSASRTNPNTLSDFKGGASPDHGQVNYEKMSPVSMLDKFSQMTDAEMDSHLAKLG
jgi:hypothetical protein